MPVSVPASLIFAVFLLVFSYFALFVVVFESFSIGVIFYTRLKENY